MEKSPASDARKSTGLHAELDALVKSANAGDPGALAQIRCVLDQNPQVWQQVGDLGAHVQTVLIATIAIRDRLLGDALARTVVQMKQSLTEPGSPLLEKLAADRVIAAWLQVQLCDLRCASLGESPRGWAGSWFRHRDQSHKCYDRAVAQLLNIRRLLGRSQRRPEVPAGSTFADQSKQTRSNPIGENQVPVQFAARASTVPSAAAESAVRANEGAPPASTIRAEVVDDELRVVPFPAVG